MKIFTLFAVGALIYGMIEISVRGFTHITMGLLGGQEPAFVGQFTMYQDKYHLDEDSKKAKSKKSSK